MPPSKTPLSLAVEAAPRGTWSVLFLLCTVTSLVYWSGLSGPFVFDDYNNIVDNPRLRIESVSLAAFWEATLAGDAGPLKRPLSMFSFAANHALSGMAPFPFKLTNLFIHLLNGVLVLLLCRRLLNLLPETGCLPPRVREGIALTTTGIWLLHPVQLTSILYVVQRMTSLSATFVLAGLLVFLGARDGASNLRRRLVLLWLGVPLCGFFATMAKENGLLLFLYAYVIELMAFQYVTRPGERWGTPKQFFCLTVGLPLLAIAIYLLITPEWFAYAAANRPFTVIERLWTESRVLFLYLQLLFVPAISDMALFYDDFQISRGWFDPVTTIFAIGALGTVLLLALKKRRTLPWFTFAVLWFLAGHAMESTIVNLELIHPHRNYIAFMGPMLAICVYGERFLRQTKSRLRWCAAIAIIVLLAAVTGLRAHQWRNPLDLAAYEVIHRPNSPRANYEIARLLNMVAVRTNNDAIQADAIRYLRRAAELAPAEISSLIGIAVASRGMIPDDVLQEIVRRLRDRPMGLNQVSYVHSLINCQRMRECHTPPHQIQAIFSALLGQPALRPRVKAEALTMLGIYYVEQLADARAGIELMQEAVALQPKDPARYINLAQAQLFDANLAAAKESVAQASALDRIGAHESKIESLRTALEDRMELKAEARAPSLAGSAATATARSGAGSDSQPMTPKTQPQLHEPHSLVETPPGQDEH